MFQIIVNTVLKERSKKRINKRFVKHIKNTDKRITWRKPYAKVNRKSKFVKKYTITKEGKKIAERYKDKFNVFDLV